MKFIFDIIEMSSVRHTVDAENLMEAETKINKIHCSGKLNVEKYGVHDSEIKLVKITND